MLHPYIMFPSLEVLFVYLFYIYLYIFTYLFIYLFIYIFRKVHPEWCVSIITLDGPMSDLRTRDQD